MCTRGTECVQGYDLYRAEEIILEAKTTELGSTQMAILVPLATYGRNTPRLGLGLERCIDIVAGMVTEDYHGAIKVILINHSMDYIKVKIGDGIAKLVL